MSGEKRGGQRALDGFQMSNEMDPAQTEEPFLLCWAHKPGSKLNMRQQHCYSQKQALSPPSKWIQS